MDLELTEQQRLFRQSIRDFARKEVAPLAADIDERERFPTELVSKIADLGLFGLTIPPAFGGQGGSELEAIIATEELSWACPSTALVWGASVSLCAHSILHGGSEAQKRRFLPPLAGGKRLGAFALSEASCGSDAVALRCHARRDGDDYVLNGTKYWITNGAEADTLVIYTTVDPSLRAKGITAFVVERGMKGFSVGKLERKMGIRGTSPAELVFNDCRVPADNRLGLEGAGFRLAMEIIDGSRVGIGAQALGIAQAAYDAAFSYARQRQAFGQAIVSFQAIQWMLADMATELDAARLLTYRAAWMKDQGMDYARASAMAKLYASETANRVATEAIQVHGGYGYIRDFNVERYFRDARITSIYEGTSEAQRIVISRSILKE
ncbi:MAG: acyl-CoA dehydrogenase family protein [Candidatus Latescibacteria bacterium]|nr:acyl-CoA dehydrogenase family protein [Candidatus Latescibacterota bacterium]